MKMPTINYLLSIVFVFILWSLFCGTAHAKQGPEKVTFLRNELSQKIKIKKEIYWLFKDEELSEKEFLKKLVLLEKQRNGLISQITRLLRKTKSKSQRVNLNLRLARLFFEQYYVELTKAYRRFEREIASQKGKKRKSPSLKKRRATAVLNKARRIYKRLLRNHPNDSRHDEMLYFYANSSMDKGLMGEGISYFKILIDQHPRSPFVPDALIQLGDYYFEKAQFSSAERYYDRLIRSNDKSLLHYAKYKKAWCAYNLRKPALALRLFKWIINNDTGQSKDVAIHIRNEALSDIALPFVDLKRVKKAIAFFQSFDDPTYRTGLNKMASIYRDRGQYRHAISLWKVLLDLNPNHSENPKYDIEIINALRLSKRMDKAIHRLFNRLSLYFERDSDWYDENDSNDALIEDTRKEFEKIARQYALEQHSTGQKVKNKKLYQRARLIYSRYLEYFDGFKDSSQIRFNLAEILYKDKEFQNAAQHYYRIYQNVGTVKLGQDSLSAALLSLNQHLNIERKKLGLSAISANSDEKLKDSIPLPESPLAFSSVEEQFINFTEEYLKEYPKEDNSADVLYEQAYLYYDHYDFKTASTHFEKLISLFPSHPNSYSAAHLLMDIYNKKADYSALISICKTLLGNKSLRWKNLRIEVADILRHAELKRIQLVEEKEQHQKAADAYIWYSNRYGYQDETLFEKALFNASVNYVKANNYPKAIQAQEKHLQVFPRTRLKKQILIQLAKNYETIANLGKAAEYYDSFRKKYPKDSQAKTAHRLAALYYWGAGNDRRAESLLKYYMFKYPRDASLAKQSLILLYQQQGSLDKQITFHRQEKNKKRISQLEFVEHSILLSEAWAQKKGRIPSILMKNTVEYVNKHKRSLRRTPKGVQLMSKVLFWDIHEKEKTFRNIRLNVSENKLAGRLQKKLARLKIIEKEYEKLAALGDVSWGLGAIYQTASLYQSTIYSVLQAPPPKSLTAPQLSYYHSEIKQTILDPLGAKVKELVNKCLDRAAEFNLLSPWSSRCYSMANRIQPQEYQQVRTLALPALETALVLPANDENIKRGEVKKYSYYSSYLFPNKYNERVASMLKPRGLVSYYQELRDLSGANRTDPISFPYRSFSEFRISALKSAFHQIDSARQNQSPSFAYLNLLRLWDPKKAETLILKTLKKNPHSFALHNLLGLTYLELGNLGAARVTWLSLLARGFEHSAIWNNLGVTSVFSNNEKQAEEYFLEANKSNPSKQAHANLGFLHLKYRNAPKAKELFELALSIKKTDSNAHVGHVVAQIQNRDYDGARTELSSLSDRFRKDPYARLSIGYFLIDVEKDFELAGQVLAGYLKVHPKSEGSFLFRNALRESSRNSAIMAIPMLDVPTDAK